MSAKVGVITAMPEEMTGLPDLLHATREGPPRGRERIVRGGFDTDEALRVRLVEASEAFLADELRDAVPAEVRDELAIATPKVIVGTIASGQTLGLSRADKRVIGKIDGVRCIDFESAAVAQVGWELGVPVGIVRSIANTTRNAARDFSRFLSGAAGHYTTGIVRRLLS